MIKIKSTFIRMAACIFVFLLIALMTACDGYIPPINHYTDENLCEKYTSSDRLYCEDGKFSQRTISDFAYDLAEKEGELVPELEQVIPTEYLGLEQGGTTFRYMGTEYGFIVYHRDGIMDIVILDFTRTIKGNEVKYRIEIPVSHSFQIREDKDGQLLWKCIGQSYENNSLNVYLSNLSLENAVLNENDSNRWDTDGFSPPAPCMTIRDVRVDFGGLKCYQNSMLKDVDSLFISSKMGSYMRKYNENGLDDFFASIDTDHTEENLAEKTIRFSGEGKIENFFQMQVNIITFQQHAFLTYGSFLECTMTLDGEYKPTRIIQRVKFWDLGRFDCAEQNYTVFEEPKQIYAGAMYSFQFLPHGRQLMYFYAGSDGEYDLVVQRSTSALAVKLIDMVTGEETELTQSGFNFRMSLVANRRYMLDISLKNPELAGMVTAGIQRVEQDETTDQTE